MLHNIGSTDALLSRVSQQLNQNRKSTKSNDDLQNYLNSLKKQTKGGSVTFKDISDISFSSEDTSIDISDSSKQDVQEKFFKKDLNFRNNSFIKPSPNLSIMKRSQTDELLNSKSFDSEIGNLTPSFQKAKSSAQTSSALERASKLFAKFGKKSSDVGRSSGVKSHKTDNENSSGKLQNDRKNYSHDLDKSTSDDNIGKSGRRFLKPQLSKESHSGVLSAVTDKESEKKSELKTESVKEVSHSYSGVTSGDESLAEFIGKLESPSEATHEDVPKELKQNKDFPSTNKSLPHKPHFSLLRVRSPSPSRKISTSRTPSPGVKSSIEDKTVAESLTAETIPEEEDEADIEEVLSESNKQEDEVDLSEDLSRMNIFNIDDLELASAAAVSSEKEESETETEEQVVQQTSKKPKKNLLTSQKVSDVSVSEDIPERGNAANIFSSFGVHSIEELIPRNHSALSNHQTVSFEGASIVKTASHLEESIAESVPEDSIVSDVPLGRKRTPSVAVLETYSEDFTTLSNSKSESAEYTEDFHTLSASKTVDKVTNTSTIFVTESKVSKKKRHKTHKMGSSVATQTQESDFKPCLECLYKNQDWKGRPLHEGGRTKIPPPKTGYYPCGLHSVINQNVYNPNLQVVQDMMRQQVEFTQQFCESQKYLYHTLTDSIQPSYVYTTLKDTKEYIRKHRKPKLTLKKALKLVELEARLQ
ncbi:Hypothetical predicted protein [Octopus vulgaris]|uniref:DUF4614 domain-containing protein n=1 Tax=Octopus vulgaris TaxID=6645 RepID=A0AA36B7L8_OCTVU|nr:Hypothetical predicted protein [Octopus vulgaris]